MTASAWNGPAVDRTLGKLKPATELAGKGPQLIAERGVYTVLWHVPEQVQFEFDLLRVDRRTGTMTAEVTVWTHWPVTDYIHSASLNLSSTQARSTLAKHLAGRVKDRELDWPALVETAVVKVRNAYRAGEPAILLRDAPEPMLSGAILPPIVSTEGATLWYGDGGTGKSELALAAGCVIHSGRGDVLAGLEPVAMRRTAFLDWEWTASVHRGRLSRLWPDDELPDLMYVRCSLPLAQDVERLRRMVREHGIEFVVIDSVALAAGGDPERAETAIEFYGGLRQLEVDALLIAHVTKQGDGEKPFGSTFWHNSARSTWYVRKAQDAGSSSLRVAMVNKKANDAPLALPLGLEIEHGPASTVIRRTDLAADSDLAREVPLRLRIKEALMGGSLSYAELAERLEADPDSVRRTVARWVGKSFSTWTDDGVLRVGVLAHD
jgi:hypothetical protein